MNNDLTLLYVEDDELIRENLTEVFKLYFNKVFTTDNGNEAIEIYNKHHIDVVILDISIPGINGLRVAEKIREVDSDVLLLIISAHSDEEKLLKAVNLNFFAYMVKPVTYELLDSKIKSILAKLNVPNTQELTLGYSWDKEKQQLFYKDILISLTKNEIQVVDLLVENKSHYLNADEIRDVLVGKNLFSKSSTQNIVQIISRFKKKLFKVTDSSDFFIENCYGLGYRVV